LNKIGSGDGPGLTGTNTFSGQINIQAATLALVGSESENGQPSVYVAPGARLAIGNGFNGGFATIGNLTGGGMSMRRTPQEPRRAPSGQPDYRRHFRRGDR